MAHSKIYLIGEEDGEQQREYWRRLALPQGTTIYVSWDIGEPAEDYMLGFRSGLDGYYRSEKI